MFLPGLVILCLSVVDGRPADQNVATNYLKKFGYIPEVESSGGATAGTVGQDGHVFKEAIRKFQEFAGLEQTGELDEATEKLMNAPRCGVTDSPRHKAGAAPGHKAGAEPGHKAGAEPGDPQASGGAAVGYTRAGSSWSSNENGIVDVSYDITKYSKKSGPGKSDVDEAFRKAFHLWEVTANLRFRRRKNPDIEVRYEEYSHGDEDAFDGPFGTLAHAFFPEHGGDLHMDDSERWTLQGYQGTNLLQVATHEIGHSLGLDHSNVRDSVMAPFYQDYDPNFRLKDDDVRAIQAIYGSKSSPNPEYPKEDEYPGNEDYPQDEYPVDTDYPKQDDYPNSDDYPVDTDYMKQDDYPLDTDYPNEDDDSVKPAQDDYTTYTDQDDYGLDPQQDDYFYTFTF